MSSNNGEYHEIFNRLDRMDEKTEFFNSELFQKYGRKLGFETGFVYGLLIGAFVAFTSLLLLF